MASQSLYGACLDFRNNASFIAVASGAEFVVDQAITGLNGKLIKRAGGTISGETITFDDGIFQDEGTSSLLSAIFNPIGRFLLNGSDKLRVDPGTLLQEVRISGIDNKIEGHPVFSSDVILQDNTTTVSLALFSTVNKNILLNGGTVFLENDLIFSSDNLFTGSGTIKGGGYKIATGPISHTINSSLVFDDPEFELHACLSLASSITFVGDNTINGRGNVLDLSPGGDITVAPGSILYLTDITIKGLGIGGGSIILAAADSELMLSDTYFELIGPFSFSNGSVTVKSPGTWYIKEFDLSFVSGASLTVDGVTLWTDEAGAVTSGIIDISGGSLSLVSEGAIKCVTDCSQIDMNASMIDMLKTSTGELQSEIDVNISMIDMLKTSTGELQSQIDVNASCCEMNATMIDMLKTSTGELQSEIDVNISMIDMLKTSSGELQSQIDNLCALIGCSCSIAVTSTMMTFDPVHTPTAGATVRFEFDRCYAGCNNLPRIIFDAPVTLPAGSRMAFSGNGIVELKDGAAFVFEGTPYCLDSNPPANPQADWPSLVIEDGAIMHLDTNATVTLGGQLTNPDGTGGGGCIVVRECGAILLDRSSHLVIGSTYKDDLSLAIECASSMRLTNTEALITFQKGCSEIIFDHHSALSIIEGTVEFNMYRGSRIDFDGNEAEGVVNKLYFREGSHLEVERRGLTSGLIRFAPNFNPDADCELGNDVAVDFDNTCGEVCGRGHMEFKEFVCDNPLTLSLALVPCQRIMFAAGTTFSQAVSLTSQILYEERTELTADTLIPAGSILFAGSIINGTPISSDLTVATNTVFARGTVLAQGTIIAGISLASATPLTAAILIPPLTKIPAGSVLASNSERVNTRLNIQERNFVTIDRMAEIFMQLGYITPEEDDGLRETEEATILVRSGSFDPKLDSRLAALCPPQRDGIHRDASIVCLKEGDHDVQYNRGTGSNVLNEVIGFDFSNRQFVITNCDETTRHIY